MSRHTLAGRCDAVLEVKKSRFHALAAPVDQPDAALAFLDQVANSTATHNCWAYRIGNQYRSSDDGEPGGTAGRPILAAIDGSGLDGVMVVVTRWFGGIKLGAGGLIRAYGGAAAECLRLAARVELVDTVELELRCEFALTGALHALLKTLDVDKLDERFEADGVVLHLRARSDRIARLTDGVRDLSRGRARLAPWMARVDRSAD
jgi:uncharacterized YigZ family protein